MDDPPYYLYIGGNAGTGKSYLLKTMINAAKLRGKRSGAELDKPVCLTLAPTGVAAYLIGGSTIESALGMQPSRNNTYIKSEPSKNSSLRFLYEDLLVIFIDEISMCGSNMLARINYRLQDIMGNNLFMGGISIVTTGDFGQLPPVGQSMIWETSRIDNRIEICPNYWDENFKIFFLTEKMRSQDEEFSRICDKVRIGECDNEVKTYMQNHVGKSPSEDSNEKFQTGKFCIIVSSNKARDKINNQMLDKLLPEPRTFFMPASDKSLNNPNAPKIADDLPLTRTGQLPTNLKIKAGAPCMITSNHPKNKYKMNGIVNGARGFIDSIQMSKDDPDIPEVVWVRFNDDNIGQLLRKDSIELLKNHTPNDKLAVPIEKQKKRFQMTGHTEYLRDQFALTLSYSVTTHKSQGATLEETKVDYTDQERIIKGSFYTGISRIRLGKNLFLADFKPEYVKANPEVEKKMKAMQLLSSHKFKKTYNTESIFDSHCEELKLGYININSLLTGKSMPFLNNDANLLALDYLVVTDTRLSDDITLEEIEYQLDNWIIEGRYDSTDAKMKKHMGMLLLKSKKSGKGNIIESTIDKQYTRNKIVQIQVLFVTFKHINLKVAFIYTREKPSQTKVNVLRNDLCESDLIMGDLNLDARNEEDLLKLDLLCGSRTRILNEITTIRFNQIDHVMLDCTKFKSYFSTSFINYTSDHNTLCIRVAEKGSDFNSSFKQKMSFSNEKETKTWGKQYKKSQHHGIERTMPMTTKYEGKSLKNEPIYDLSTNKQEVGTIVGAVKENHATGVDLSCLYTPNWLNDEIINDYLALLKKEDESIFVFSTFFYTAFKEHGFDRVATYYRKHNILSYTKILIPIHTINHWFLVTFNGLELISYDPYNYPDVSGKKKQQQLYQNKQFQESLLLDLSNNYFKPLYEQYGREWIGLTLKSKIPPEIPAQDNGFDCGVFLVIFAKYIVFNKCFDFGTDDMVKFRDDIRRELVSSKITFIDNRRISVESRKRSADENFLYTSGKMRKSNAAVASVPRRILNKDNETCWLNSVLQIVLTAFDYKSNMAGQGSELWQQLVAVKDLDSTVIIDPTVIKRTLISAEVKRIKNFDVAAINMLFLLRNQPNLNNVDINALGQQDSRDFFLALDEQRSTWNDLYNMFKVGLLSETECTSCGNISRQQHCRTENCFISLSCPTEDVQLKPYFESQMNGYDAVENWRDENGCGQITTGKNSTKIFKVDDNEYLVFIVDRLMEVDGNIIMQNAKIKVGFNDKITLIDSNNTSATFQIIGIIFHVGNVSSNRTSGHYMADVRHSSDFVWYRTNDSQDPIELSTTGLTETGYIYMFKRTSSDISVKSERESQSNSGLSQSTSNRNNMEANSSREIFKTPTKPVNRLKRNKGSSSKKLEFKGGSPNKSQKDISSIIPQLKDILYAYEEMSDGYAYIDTNIKEESLRRTLSNTTLTEDIIKKCLRLMTNRYVTVIIQNYLNFSSSEFLLFLNVQTLE